MPVSGTEIALVAIALYTLVTAAQRAIERALALAAHFGVSELVVGTIVLALGTSLPEVGAHLTASLGILSGVLDPTVASAVVLGANMGSSTAQQLLVFGVFLLGYGGVTLTSELVWRSYVPMVVAFALTMLVAVDGTISRLDGVILLAGYVAFVVGSVRSPDRPPVLPSQRSTHVRYDVSMLILMLVLILASASVLLTAIQSLLVDLALGGSMVGIITIGVASALPELTMVLEAIRRRTPNVAVGALLGSNVVNPFLGIGLGGLVSTYQVPAAVIRWDLPLKLVVAVGVLGVLAIRGDRTITRSDGLWFIALYFGFLTGRLLLFPGQ